jgi:hypothetical protein
MLVIDQLPADVILGLDFLESHKCIIIVATHTITLDDSISLPLSTLAILHT